MLRRPVSWPPCVCVFSLSLSPPLMIPDGKDANVVEEQGMTLRGQCEREEERVITGVYEIQFSPLQMWLHMAL